MQDLLPLKNFNFSEMVEHHPSVSWHGPVTKFFTLGSPSKASQAITKNPQEIHERMVAIYGESIPHYTTVTQCFKELKHDRNSFEDDPRCGQPQPPQ